MLPLSPSASLTLRVPSPPTPSSKYGIRAATDKTMHLSPRKFHQLQQKQRQAVLRGHMPPLVPPTPSSSSPTTTTPSKMKTKGPVPWNPAWLPVPLDAVGAGVTNSQSSWQPRADGGLSYATMTLDEWLESYDREILQFESLELFAQVKVPEALGFCDKMEEHVEQQQTAELERLTQARTTDDVASNRLSGTSNADPSVRQGATPAATRPDAVGEAPTTALARFPIRFRIAVFANLVERTILAMTQSGALGHLKPLLLQARQELFRAIFADYDHYGGARAPVGGRRKTVQTSTSTGHPSRSSDDAEKIPMNEDEGDEDDDDDDSDEEDDDDLDDQGGSQQRRRWFERQMQILRQRRECRREPSAQYGPEHPRTLGFFLARTPYALKIQDDTDRRAVRFQRHQVVLRRIIQSMYRSLGTVFHAWKIYVRQKREDRLNEKGAQLTAMVVMQRGLIRSIFVEWSKCTLKSKLKSMRAREMDLKKQHDERLNSLYQELFILREQNARLQDQLLLATSEVAPNYSGEIDSPVVASTSPIMEADEAGAEDQQGGEKYDDATREERTVEPRQSPDIINVEKSADNLDGNII